MKFYFITFRSITFAQRAEGVLRRNGFICVLQRTPRWMEERGCGYCLKLRQGSVRAAISTLRENGLSFSKIYMQHGEDQAEALVL